MSNLSESELFTYKMLAKSVSIEDDGFMDYFVEARDNFFFVEEDLYIVEFDAYVPAFTEYEYLYTDIGTKREKLTGIGVTDSKVVMLSEDFSKRLGGRPKAGNYVVTYGSGVSCAPR